MKTKTESENQPWIQSKKLRAFQVAVLVLGLAAANNWAQTYTVLHHFYDSDVLQPYGNMALSGTTVYGIAASGRIYRGGVFKLNTDGTGFGVIKGFTGAGDHFLDPGLALDGESLFGAAGEGPTTAGYVFTIKTDGSGFNTLKLFTGADGSLPDGNFVTSGTTLYGTTEYGGSSWNGTVFKVNADGADFASLKSFQGGSDGAHPEGGLMLSDSTLYGTTGGGTGTVFRVNTDGSGYMVLKGFAGIDGAIPRGGLVLSGMTLYGTTSAGGTGYNGTYGSGQGTVFKLNTDGSGFAVLHYFAGSDGSQPRATLMIAGSTLYGTASSGGASNCGTVFQINTDGSGFTVLKNFTGSDGRSPQSRLMLSGGTLYGTTYSGGNGYTGVDTGYGVVFSLAFDLPLTIVLQPVSQAALLGSTVEFQVEALGRPLAYQWFFNGTNAIDAATSPLLTLTNIQYSQAGDYTVVITNDSGSITSLVATLTVADPCITTQPVSRTVNVGASVEFTVGAGGTSPVGYQWLKGGAILGAGGNVSGTQTPVLTLTNVSVADAGDYSVSVTNISGSATSHTATLVVVIVPPSITTQPASQSTEVGATVQFEVVAGGTPPFSYQWFKGPTKLSDGGNLSGANTPRLTLASVVGGDAGGYSVSVSNAVGSVTSLVATLEVIEPPVITSQPANRSTNFGATVQFGVVVGGTSPFSYQWFKGATLLGNGGNISGAQSPTLTLANVVGADAGGYSVLVSNPVGSVPSLAATLTVADPWIAIQPFSQTVILGQSAVFSVGAIGTPPLSYQWRKNGVNLTGQHAPTLAFVNVQTADSGNYDVLVSNLYGAVSGAVVALAVLPQSSGDVDLSFDSGSSVNGQIRGMVVQTNGGFVIVGDFTTVPGVMRSNIARFNPDGSFDPAFAPEFSQKGYPYLSVGALALQNDGQILIGGSFTSVNGVTRSNLARLNPDGSVDNSFLNGLSGPNGPDGSVVVGKIEVQNDGKIFIAGRFTSINGIPRTNFARLNADGSLDPSFLNGLAGPNGRVSTMSLQSDGKVLLGGEFTLVNGVARPRLARLNADGSLDETFLNGLSGPNGRVSGVAVQTDGSVLIAGLFQSVNGVTKTNLARLNTDGSLDETFLASLENVGPGGVDPVFVLQNDGRILIGGGFALINGVGRTNLARLNPDGSLDESFLAILPIMVSTDGGVSAFAFQTDGKLLVSGFSMMRNWYAYLTRLNVDGSRDNSFDTGSTGPESRVSDFAVQPDGRLLIGGDFTSISGAARGHFARLMPDGSLDDSFLNGLGGADRSVLALALQSDGKVLIGGDFYVVNGVAQKGIARLHPDGSLDNSFTPILEGNARAVYGFGLQSDGKILIGGSFTSVNGLVQTNLARLNPDGSSDSTFVGSAHGSLDTVHVVVQQSDGRIVIGGFFSMVNGVSRNRIARLNHDGSLDSSFLNGLSGADQAVWAIAVQGDGRTLVGGWFNTINGVARKYLARLNVDGSLDNSFFAGQAGPSGGVQSLALQSDGKILVGGGFSSFNGVARGNLARLNADGALDNSFLEGLTGADQTVSCLTQLTDGDIVIGGDFSAVNGVPRRFVARLTSGYAPPVVETAPQSETTEAGNIVKLRINAFGYPPPAIQWFFNGNLLEGCTNFTLEFVNAQPLHSGAYTAIITNAVGSVTSAPVMLSVIAPVERRTVPGLNLFGEAGSLLNVDYVNTLSPAPDWVLLDTVSLISTSQYCFDLTATLPPQRFYRAWKTGTPAVLPSLNFNFVPAITLTGDIGNAVRVDGINQFGPTDAWFTLDTVTLTNTTQLYFDVSAPGQPGRLYRLVPVP